MDDTWWLKVNQIGTAFYNIYRSHSPAQIENFSPNSFCLLKKKKTKKQQKKRCEPFVICTVFYIKGLRLRIFDIYC